MLTVCPKCTLTLAVTAADLRIGQGYVRCGRCATVFNALLALSDASTLELPGTALPDSRAGHTATATVSVADSPFGGPARGVPPAPATTDSPEPEAGPDTLAAPLPPQAAMTADIDFDNDPDITIDPSLAAEPLDMVLEQTSAVAAPAAGDAATVASLLLREPDTDVEVEAVEAVGTADEVKVEAGPARLEDEAIAALPDPALATPGIETRETSLDATGTVQTIVMEGSSISQSEEFVDIDTIDSEIAAATRRALEAEARKSIASLDHDLGVTGTHARNDDSGEAAAAEAVETRLTESGTVYVHDRNSLYARRQPPPKPQTSNLLWSGYAALLLLVLGVQAIHFWRNDLAVRNDWIGQSLTHIYAVLGLPLTPNWDLHGYDVRQLGAATNGSGDDAIRVRIRLSNRATRAQPWPVLRLSLYNRYGKRVAARDLMPRDYLPRDKAGDLMPVAQEIDSEVAVMDPGPDASSFELDVCIPAQRGLRCAGDSPLRPAARS